MEDLRRCIDEEYPRLKARIPWSDFQAGYTYAMVAAVLEHVNNNTTATLLKQFSVAVHRKVPELQGAPDEATWWEILKQCAAGRDVVGAGAKKRQPEEDQLCQEFEGEYQDPGGSILSYVLDYIDQCYRCWSRASKTWYAPCVAIVQSNGWGKSRAVREIALAPNQVMVFYFSLMDPRHSGYPRSNPDIFKHFRSITKVEHAYAVFHACFDWLSEKDTFPSKVELFRDHQRKCYDRVLPKIQAQPECSKECMINTCTTALKKHATSLRSNGVCFLFVLDEARTLLQPPEAAMGWELQGELPFVLFRRASADLPLEGRSFVLFVDTASRVSNFTPASRYDPSSKVV